MHPPHVTSGHKHMRTYTHMHVHRKNECVSCKYWSEYRESQGISIDVHGARGCKCGGGVRNWHCAWGWEGGCASASGACSNFILGFFPSWFSFFSAAEQTPCLQGRCLMSQIQSLECLISCGQACFWQLTFLTARCWKTHTPQTINTMLKTQSWGKTLDHYRQHYIRRKRMMHIKMTESIYIRVSFHLIFPHTPFITIFTAWL